MGVRNLDAIFRPSSVAVIGASNSVGSVGDTLWRNLAADGFAGEVFPINPKHDSVQGARAFASIKDVPRAPDLAVICVPAPAVPGVVRECGEAGVRGGNAAAGASRVAVAIGSVMYRDPRLGH